MNMCNCYREEYEVVGWHTSVNPKTKLVTRCWGTRERDECSCGGCRTKCDFYPEVREKALKEQAPKFGKWIRVKDRLPDKDQDVLCYSNKDGGYMFFGYRGYISGEFMEGGSLHIGDVTHWMPLPEPPKGE